MFKTPECPINSGSEKWKFFWELAGLRVTVYFALSVLAELMDLSKGDSRWIGIALALNIQRLWRSSSR